MVNSLSDAIRILVSSICIIGGVDIITGPGFLTLWQAFGAFLINMGVVIKLEGKKDVPLPSSHERPVSFLLNDKNGFLSWCCTRYFEPAKNLWEPSWEEYLHEDKALCKDLKEVVQRLQDAKAFDAKRARKRVWTTLVEERK